MDFGSTQTTGQVVIGNIHNKTGNRHPTNTYRHLTQINVITKKVNYSTMKEKESSPSCSQAEVLEKQYLFINSMLTQMVCDILWRMFKEEKTLYRRGLMLIWKH